MKEKPKETTATTEPKVVHPRRLLLCQGMFVSAKGEAFTAWVALPADWAAHRTIDESWPKYTYAITKNSQRARAGNIYEFQYPEKEPTSIFPKSGQYKGMFHSKELVARLQAEEDAQRLDFAIRKAEAKNSKRKVYLELLEPLRRAYWGMNPTEKAVFCGRVMKALTSHSPLVSWKDAHE